MKKTTQGFLAGAAGLGLLLGGSTFALWSDSANLDQQSISSGNLEVKVNSTNWRDMSPDRTDNLWGKGHKIKDLKKFKIIPGDKIQGEFELDLALEGENMVAQLKMAPAGKHPKGDLADGLKITYEVQDHRGKTIETGDNRGVMLTLASEDNGNNRGPGRLPTVSPRPDGRAELRVVVTVEFDKNTSDRDLTRAHTTLSKSELQLTQVREKVHGYTGGRR